jgi:hypothetical protein
MKENNKIALIVTSIYFLTFVIMISSEFCMWCTTILHTIFLIPTLTVLALGYGGQSFILIWTLVTIEMIFLFIILKLIIRLILKRRIIK